MANQFLHSSYDVVIAGARCAGAATAMLLARSGLRVLAVDRSAYGSDALSTHALMRGGVLQLQRWGLLDRIRASDTPAIRSTLFHYGNESIAVEIKPKHGVDALYAPRRTLLDPLLADAARDAGAEVRHGVRVRDLLRRADGAVAGAVIEDASGRQRAVEAGLVIGADGVKSTVARLAGAARYRQGLSHTAITYGYFAGVRTDRYHWCYAPGASVGVIPTGGGLACLFLSVPGSRFGRAPLPDGRAGFTRALSETVPPELAPVLRDARPVGALRRFSGLPGYLRTSFGPGYALVGDAGSFKDPIAAHGITDALRDAESLARAVRAGGSQAALADYQAARDGHAVRLLEVADAIASFRWDLPGVQALHVALSEAMADEVRAIVAFDARAGEAA